jgi:hypothetical protein
MAGKLTRFLNLEKPRPAGSDTEPPRAVANAARFGGEAPLALDESGEMLSLRCPSCEADNNRVAERCFNCQRALQTTEVHAWNEAYQRQRKAAEPPPEPPVPAVMREPAPVWNWGADERADTTAAGLRLLGLIGDRDKRMMAAVAMAATFLLSALVALTATGHTGVRVGAGMLALLLVALFVPSTRRKPWWDRD